MMILFGSFRLKILKKCLYGVIQQAHFIFLSISQRKLWLKIKEGSRWHLDDNKSHGWGNHMCMEENFLRTGEAREKRMSAWGKKRPTPSREVNWGIRMLRKINGGSI